MPGCGEQCVHEILELLARRRNVFRDAGRLPETLASQLRFQGTTYDLSSRNSAPTAERETHVRRQLMVHSTFASERRPPLRVRRR
jgi:hypothetical protein